MGIALPTTPGTRSTIVSTTYTVIALVFFFGVGLAGGTAYKLLWADDSDQQAADQAAAAPDADETAPEDAPQTAAAPSPDNGAPDHDAPDHDALANGATTDTPPGNSAPSAIAPQMAQLAPSAPPSVPPPAPMAAATVTPPPFVSAAPTATEPVPYVEAAPTAPAVAAERRAAVPPRKPHLAAKTAHPAQTETALLHAPPAGPANVAGPFLVQFGAFANEDNARRVQWAVEATGLKVEVTQAPGASGQPLYYLRSPDFHDYAAALSAAQTVQDRVQHFVNAIPIDYAILGDHATIEQQAEAR
jgi:hypothetical protein